MSHQERLQVIHERYKDIGDWAKEYFEAIDRQLYLDLRAAVRSVYPRSRKALFEGHSSPELGTQLAIYQELRECLKSKDFSDRFLRQLSILVFTDSRAKELMSDDALRHAVERLNRNPRERNRTKRPKK